MAKLAWDKFDNISYEFGVNHGVLYFTDGTYKVWNGLLSVTEKPIDEDSNTVYIDGIKIFEKVSTYDFEAEVEAFLYPEEIDNGKKVAGFSYSTTLNDEFYTLHIVYNPLFSANGKSYYTEDEESKLLTFIFDVTTKSVDLNGLYPASHLSIVIDSKIPEYMVNYISDILYGTDTSDPYLPDPNHLIYVYDENKNLYTLLIIDNGDGTWSALGNDDVISEIDSTTYSLISNGITAIDANAYTIQSS